MIQIDKTGVPVPFILSTSGITETRLNNEAYTAGIRKFSFNNKIYGHATIKATLIRLQNDKCCFCERKVSAGEPGHIEHYRPKGGYKIDNNSRLIKPGYYWLAYDFENLFFSCNRCNTSYKKNYFPLADETQRATSHTGDINNEEPLILSPLVDPTSHLIFEQEMIKPKNQSIKGEETIKRTGLNRKALADDRMLYLAPFKLLAEFARGNGPQAQEIRDHFRKCCEKNSPYSYMIICNFPDLV